LYKTELARAWEISPKRQIQGFNLKTKAPRWGSQRKGSKAATSKADSRMITSTKRKE